jgi:hypothetical protein
MHADPLAISPQQRALARLAAALAAESRAIEAAPAVERRLID